MTALPDLCQIASQRYFDKRRWLNLWTLLLWIFGATIVIFSVVTIMLFIRETWLPGALTTVGTIVSGAGITWVVARRTEAEKEESSAFNTLVEECKDKRGAISPEALTFQRAYPTEQQLKDMAWKSLLFGRQSEQQLFGD